MPSFLFLSILERHHSSPSSPRHVVFKPLEYSVSSTAQNHVPSTPPHPPSPVSRPVHPPRPPCARLGIAREPARATWRAGGSAAGMASAVPSGGGRGLPSVLPWLWVSFACYLP